MRTRMCSPLLLLVGLTLGLTAMWAVASPVGATGDLVTGDEQTQRIAETKIQRRSQS